MLSRILSDVVISLLVAGALTSIVVPIAMQLGYEPGPRSGWIAIGIAVASLVTVVVVGERARNRQKTRQSP